MRAAWVGVRGWLECEHEGMCIVLVHEVTALTEEALAARLEACQLPRLARSFDHTVGPPAAPPLRHLDGDGDDGLAVCTGCTGRAGG